LFNLTALEEMTSHRKSCINQVQIQEVINLADPVTNVIVLDGSMVEDKYQKIYDELEFEYYDDDGNMGPFCHLCSSEICPEGNFIVMNDTRFLIIWKDDI